MGPLATLLKIQELELVIKESAIVHTSKDLETGDLNDEITSLKSTVPEKILAHYEKFKKNGLGIAQEIDGRCRACHMSIPVGNLTRIQTGKDEPVCPNCGVYIYAQTWDETH